MFVFLQIMICVYIRYMMIKQNFAFISVFKEIISQSIN